MEKVAIYADAAELVTHMARQIANGRWTSKLGASWDIEHLRPECLNSDCYGTFLICLARPVPAVAGLADEVEP